MKTFTLPLGHFVFEKPKPLTDDEIQNMKAVPYVKLGGSLPYLSTTTRLYLGTSVYKLAKHMANPAPRHWTALKHLIKCLIVTRDIGIILKSPAKEAQRIRRRLDSRQRKAPLSLWSFDDVHDRSIIWSSKLQNFI